VRIGGMCKGSGMIHPNMATMLGVVTTDAAVAPQAWRAMLRAGCDASFNSVRALGGAGVGWLLLLLVVLLSCTALGVFSCARLFS
jgi:glutamate N-acetyltransferase/amino-acid N-acetyltransferase